MAAQTSAAIEPKNIVGKDDISLNTQPPEGANDTDAIKCICASTKERRGNRGTVQCSRCSSWSHMACYDLLTKDANKSSFVFVCDPCSAIPPSTVPAIAPPVAPNMCNTHQRSLSQPLPGPPLDKMISSQTCTYCAKVPKLKETVNHLSLQIRSLQLQLLTLREKVENPHKAVNPQMARKVNPPYKRPGRHTHGTPHEQKTKQKNTPSPAPPSLLRSNSLSNGSREYFISPREGPAPLSQRPREPPHSAFVILWGTKLNTTEEMVNDSAARCLRPEDI